MNNEKLVWLSLRIGVAFAFLYPALSAAFFNPEAWIGYFPPLLLDWFAGNENILLHGFGLTEVVIGVWILWGKKIFIPSSLAVLYLLGIVAFNFPQMDIVFRDLSIAFMALALALKSRSPEQIVIAEERVTVIS